MTAIPARQPAGSQADLEWAEIAARAPRLAETMARYLAQAATFLAPTSVEAADNAFRQLARWLLASTEITAVAAIGRDDIEDFKVWLATARHPRRALVGEHPTATAAHAAGVLRTDHRVGLARRADA